MLSIARRKRKPNLNGSEVPTTTFADVAGMESAKRELAEVGSWLLAEREEGVLRFRAARNEKVVMNLCKPLSSNAPCLLTRLPHIAVCGVPEEQQQVCAAGRQDAVGRAAVGAPW